MGTRVSSSPMLLRNSFRVAGSLLGPISVRTKAWSRSAGREYPPIRNVTVWLPPHSQGAPRKERCTRFSLILLTLHVLPVWLTLQRFP